MELWIRTQNRMRLIKPNRLHIQQESKNFGGDWYIYESQNSLRYGTYSTKKRVLEILDEIQDLINDISDGKMVGCVYEMPME